MTDLNADTKLKITVDTITLSGSTLTKKRIHDGEEMPLDDLVNVIAMGGICEFSTELPNLLTRLTSETKPSGESCILRIDEIDGRAPTEDDFVHLGAIYDIVFDGYCLDEDMPGM